jgi:excisionase family DNA binding protein
MLKMRTIRQAYSQLHAEDPGCQIGQAFLYQLVRGGAIPHVRAGKRILLDYDNLLKYLAGETGEQTYD